MTLRDILLDDPNASVVLTQGKQTLVGFFSHFADRLADLKKAGWTVEVIHDGGERAKRAIVEAAKRKRKVN